MTQSARVRHKNRFVEKFLRALDQIEYGQLQLFLPDGQEYCFGGVKDGPKSDLRIYDIKVLSNLAAKSDIGFAEDYMAQKWDTGDLPSLLQFGMANEKSLVQFFRVNKLFVLKNRFFHWLRSNTVSGSSRNIMDHYDLGNDFFSHWLDPSMTYSSALFAGSDVSLQEAQYNKYDRILSRIGGRQSDILEIGCGWGGFVERAVERIGHRLRGITLSPAQHKFSVARLGKYGDHVDIGIQDYRRQEGNFGAIVSIEMFEAVGERYWKVFFAKVKSLLRKEGKALIQAITIRDDLFSVYRRNTDFIRAYIFPGGMLPSPSHFISSAREVGLRLTDQFSFGQDYARTLKMWLSRFDLVQDQLRGKKYDERFIRMWRFYLAACIASFSHGNLTVSQFELRHA